MDISKLVKFGGGNYTSLNREPYWDTLKGWLIILVVFGHFLHLGFNAPNVVLINWIYSFHMPVFVFVSGYFSNPQSKNYWKGFRRLIETYLVFQVLYTVLFKDVNINILIYPVFGLWYILSLVFWRILAYLMDRISWYKTPLLWISITLILSITICCIPINNELAFQKTISFFPYFVLGMVAKRYNVRNSNLKKYSFSFCLLLYGLTVAFFCYVREYFADVFSMSRSMYDINIPQCLDDYIGEGTDIQTFLKWSLIRTSCIVVGMISCWTHLNIPQTNLVADIGRNSMTLYIIHLFVYLLAQKAGIYLHFPTQLPFIVIYTIMVVAFVCSISNKKIVDIILNPISFIRINMKANE